MGDTEHNATDEEPSPRPVHPDDTEIRSIHGDGLTKIYAVGNDEEWVESDVSVRIDLMV